MGTAAPRGGNGGAETLDGGLHRLVGGRRQQPDESPNGVRDGAAVDAGVQRSLGGPDGEGDVEQTAQRRGEGRDLGADVDRVQGQDDVGGDQVTMVVDQAGLGGGADSSPSISTVMVTGGLGPSSRRVSRWTAMPPLSSADPRPWTRSPMVVSSRGGVLQSSRFAERLDVVVDVQQHGRGAEWFLQSAENGRGTVTVGVVLGGETDRAEIGGDRLGRPLDITPVRRIRTDRRDRDPAAQVVQHPVEVHLGLDLHRARPSRVVA